MKLYQALILSVVVHFVLFFGLKADFSLFESKRQTPVEWIELEEETPLMAEETKRVKKQTRTQETSNAPVHSLRTPPTQGTQGRVPKQGDAGQGNKLRDDVVMDSSSFLSPGGAGGTLPTGQRVQSYLPKELEVGDIVALNTDQNLYFTFYRRMAEKVVWPWVQNVISGFERLKRDRLLGGAKKWVTIVEVILDKDGKVLSTQPLKLAGYWEIDGAPVKAFKQAKKFPNPPKGMVEEDGYIRIRYKFVVYYNPNAVR